MKKANNLKSNVEIQNKKIRLNYEIKDTYQAGISLEGWEFKSILNKDIKLDNAYVIVKDMEVFLINAYIKEIGAFSVGHSTRSRKLLLHKEEIKKLIGLTQEKGRTLIPSKIYKKGNLIKIDVCLCIGKKEYNKKQDLKEKSILLDAKRSFKNNIKIK